MLDLLWLIPAVPFASAALLLLIGGRLPRRTVAAVGVLSIAISAVIAMVVAVSFLSAPPVNNAYAQLLWSWIDVAGFRPEIALYLDPLSLVMTLVITFVAFWIHLYSAEFMV